MRVSVRVAEVEAVLVCSSLLLACCGLDGPTSTLRDLASEFHDGAWVMTVDRALRRGVFPGQAASLADSDYEAVAPQARYQLELSAAGRTLRVAEPAMTATLERADAGELRYGIDAGTFAGGRVVVWRGAGGLQGELTIFGSGVPIARSERGPLRERTH